MGLCKESIASTSWQEQHRLLKNNIYIYCKEIIGNTIKISVMISEHITRHIWARIKQNPIKISVMISQHITRHIWARIKQHHIRISVMISQHITRHIWAANQTKPYLDLSDDISTHHKTHLGSKSNKTIS